MAAQTTSQGGRECLFGASLGGGLSSGAQDSGNTRDWDRLELGSDITIMCGLHGPVHAALTVADVAETDQ